MADDGADGGTDDVGAGHGGNGEWWRSAGPWKALGAPRGPVDGAGTDGPGGEEPGVYEQPGATGPAGAAADASGVRSPQVPVAMRGPADVADSPAGGAFGGPGAGLTFPGWDSVRLEGLEPEPGPEPAAVPAPRAEPAPAPQAAAASGPRGWFGRRGPAPAAAPAAPAAAGPSAVRKPAPLLLVASAALLAGAVTGQLLAMLLGWGAAYLSRGLSDFTRKFAVLGIPLITMSGSAVWFWGRTRGRWGAPLAEGDAMNHALWVAAPGVLRLAAVLTAVFLLALTLRRRPPQ